jgi:prevent-host-death family protein
MTTERLTDSAPLTAVRDNLSELLDEITSGGSDLVITRHGKPVAVVIAHDDYEAILETLNILSDPDTMAALAEAEADLDAGDLIEL